MVEAVKPIRSVRWYNSLMVRVMLLCTMLLFCLLGLVYLISQYYVGEMQKQMEAKVEEIADNIVVKLDVGPEEDINSVQLKAETLFQGAPFTIRLRDIEPEAQQRNVTLRWENGQLFKRGEMILRLRDRPLHLTVNVTSDPLSEIFHAFHNQYLALLVLVFVATLGVMVYFIAKMLRPLGELSETCAAISAGTLREVPIRQYSGEIGALEQTFNRMVESLREKEEIETKLRQAQRLSALGNLAAGIAHDIRNPLNAIKLLSSHALDSLDSNGETKPAAHHIQTIRSEVNRLEEIVSRFLSLAKETELQPEASRVDRLLEECAQLVKPDAEARGVRLITELRAGEATLTLDRKQWTRAILNVLINALEACPANGRVRMFSRVTDTVCEIEIRDDGPGMTPEVLERAFDPYYTTKRTGTGLGLSITRGIIEEHGGTIQLSSSEGRGCQVLITIPLTARVVRVPGARSEQPETLAEQPR